jgi:hypothetical protein
MPISLEEFRKLSTVPAVKAGVKVGKCRWNLVQAEITGKAWSVKEVWVIATKHSGDRGISRTRTKRWLDKLVEKKVAMKKQDGLAVIYWINPEEKKK